MDWETNPILKWISNVRDYGLEYASRRFYSLYEGVVDSNTDPAQQGKVTVKCAVLGNGIRTATGGFIPRTISNAAKASSIYAGNDHGLYFPPEVDDMVWVSFDHGDSSVPRYHGSFWRNVDPALSAEGSHLPAEFRSTDGIPLVRGIKTGYGHGLIFNDDALTPFVLMWSGRSTELGQPANKYQRLKLSDDPSASGIFANTFYGHAIELDDTKRKITIHGRSDDPTGLLANSVTIDDTTNTITIRGKGQQIVTFDGLTMAINIVSPAAVSVSAVGAATIFAVGGVAMGSGAAPPIPPIPGTAIETGLGGKIVNFAGVWEETIGGAFTQNVVGVLSMTAAYMNLAAAILTLTGNIVVLGAAQFGLGVQKKLIHQDLLLNWLATHTHATAAPGPPSPPVEALILKDPLDLSKPNPIWITQELTAS